MIDVRWIVGGSVLFAFIGGCTTVTVNNADVSVDRLVGVAVVNVTPRLDSTSVIRTTTTGLSFGPSSATLGYLDETRFVVAGKVSCRVFILVRRTEDAFAWARAFQPTGPYADVCVSLDGGTEP